jgi:hypothetical protein
MFRHYFLTLFLLFSTFYASTQTWCALTTPEFPFTTDDDWGNYSWSAGLYMPQQIGGAQTINAISFRLDNTDGSANYSGVRIYLRHTAVSSYPNYNYPGGSDPVTQGFTLVYSGAMNFTAVDGQIYSYTLSAPFSYNGTSNLEMLIENRGGVYDSDEPWFNRTGNAGTNVYPGKIGWGTSWSGAISTASNNALRNFTLAVYWGANGTPCSAYPLAVTFKGLFSKCEEGQVVLNWETATEINNDYFIVEYSKNGEKWDSIGWVDGKGTVKQTQQYSFVYRELTNDSSPSYYRLIQVDFDGQSEHLQTIVSNCNNTEKLVVSPNPVNDIFQIHNITSDDKIEIYNAMGKLIQEIQSTSNFVEIDLSKEAKGIFFLSVISGSDKQVLKVVKQ